MILLGMLNKVHVYLCMRMSTGQLMVTVCLKSKTLYLYCYSDLTISTNDSKDI